MKCHCLGALFYTKFHFRRGLFYTKFQASNFKPTEFGGFKADSLISWTTAILNPSNSRGFLASYSTL